MSEAEQQQKLMNKYGGLPSKKGILNRRMKGQTERTFFDSADHFSGKETGSQTKKPANVNRVTEEGKVDSGGSGGSGSGDSGSGSGAGATSNSTVATTTTTTTTTSGGSGVEATQAAKLSKKYGGLPSKKGVLNRRMKGQNERTYFDSADHFSGKETGSQTKSPSGSSGGGSNGSNGSGSAPLKGNPALAHLKK